MAQLKARTTSSEHIRHASGKFTVVCCFNYNLDAPHPYISHNSILLVINKQYLHMLEFYFKWPGNAFDWLRLMIWFDSSSCDYWYREYRMFLMRRLYASSSIFLLVYCDFVFSIHLGMAWGQWTKNPISMWPVNVVSSISYQRQSFIDMLKKICKH